MTLGQSLRTFILGSCVLALLATPVAGRVARAQSAKSDKTVAGSAAPKATSDRTKSSTPKPKPSRTTGSTPKSKSDHATASTAKPKGAPSVRDKGSARATAAKKGKRPTPKKSAKKPSAVAKADKPSAARDTVSGEAGEVAAAASAASASGPRLISNWWKRPVLRTHAAVPAAAIDTVIEQSRAMLGVRYVLGGQTPGGVDCTGLANFLYRGLGYDLPRVPKDLAQVGTPVPFDTATMQRGDLIFFSRPNVKLITHVGVYVGDGKMIHASSVRHHVVETPLSSYTYMVRRGVKRIVHVADSAAVSASNPDQRH